MKNLSSNLMLIEDDPIFSKLIYKLVTNDPDEEFHITTSNSAEESVEIIKKNSLYDLFLVDLGLPDIDGIDLIKELHALYPTTPIMVLSIVTSESALLKSIQGGAVGYISKSESPSSILKAIKEVIKGNYPISPMLARYLFKHAKSSNLENKKNKKMLSKREMEILFLIADGMEYIEIAKNLNIGISTVQTHIRKLYKKLNAHSKTQAISKARIEGILN
jgi:DNA-binding NarL/FixJ family response regulator